MSFLFSLKGKVSKKPLKVEASKRKALAVEDKAENVKTTIDAFDAKVGALVGDKSMSHRPKLVIKPLNQSTKLRRKSKEEERSMSDSKEQNQLREAARSLLMEEKLNSDTSLVIPMDLTQETSEISNLGAENTQKDYDDVPVGEFGAALLRGMGWKGPDKTASSIHTKHRQRGTVLGIGAKSIHKDLELELLDKKNLSAPLIRKS